MDPRCRVRQSLATQRLRGPGPDVRPERCHSVMSMCGRWKRKASRPPGRSFLTIGSRLAVARPPPYRVSVPNLGRGASGLCVHRRGCRAGQHHASAFRPGQVAPVAGSSTAGSTRSGRARGVPRLSPDASTYGCDESRSTDDGSKTATEDCASARATGVWGSTVRWLSHGRYAHDGNLHKIPSSGVTQVSHQPVADRHVGALLGMTMPRHTGEHRGIAGTILTAFRAPP